MTAWKASGGSSTVDGVLTTVAVRGYRSLRDVVLPLGRLTVVTGPNGSGKSNLYRALRLLAATAREGAPAALAREGGLSSALWAGRESGGEGHGTRRKHPVRVELGIAGEDTGYSLSLGLPQPPFTDAIAQLFARDPEIKEERVWAGPILKTSTVLSERSGPLIRSRGRDGWTILSSEARTHESMLDAVVDPDRAPELVRTREELRSWRFYDHLRTDPEAPARTPRPGARTSALADDGGDLAAALATAMDLGRADAVDTAVHRAFPDSRIEVVSRDGMFELLLHQPGLLRPLHAAELSDGTLRFLMLTAALLTPRPPQLIVLNEPEQSMHRSLLTALARMLREAADQTQLVVVSHSPELVDELGRAGGTDTPTASDTSAVVTVELTKDAGETAVVGQDGPLDRPGWRWP